MRAAWLLLSAFLLAAPGCSGRWADGTGERRVLTHRVTSQSLGTLGAHRGDPALAVGGTMAVEPARIHRRFRCGGFMGIDCRYYDHRITGHVISARARDPGVLEVAAVEEGRIVVRGIGPGRTTLEVEVDIRGERLRDGFEIAVEAVHTLKPQLRCPLSPRIGLAAGEEVPTIFLSGVTYTLGHKPRDAGGAVLLGHLFDQFYPTDRSVAVLEPAADPYHGVHGHRVAMQRPGTGEIANRLTGERVAFEVVHPSRIDGWTVVIEPSCSRPTPRTPGVFDMSRDMCGTLLLARLLPRSGDRWVCVDGAAADVLPARRIDTLTPEVCTYRPMAQALRPGHLRVHRPGECRLEVTVDDGTRFEHRVTFVGR